MGDPGLYTQQIYLYFLLTNGAITCQRFGSVCALEANGNKANDLLIQQSVRVSSQLSRKVSVVFRALRDEERPNRSFTGVGKQKVRAILN